MHRVDLLTRLIRDPKVAASYGELEEALTEPEGEMGGAYICRIKCGPVDNYLRCGGNCSSSSSSLWGFDVTQQWQSMVRWSAEAASSSQTRSRQLPLAGTSHTIG